MSATSPSAHAYVLCVQLWCRPGVQERLSAYEDRVLALLPLSKGQVLLRARIAGSEADPCEMQVLAWPDEEAYEQYMANPARLAEADERDACVERTHIMRISVQA